MNMAALNVFLNNSTCDELKLLRDKNTKVLKAIEDLNTKREHYFNLVAIFRTDSDNEVRLNQIKTNIGVNAFNLEVGILESAVFPMRGVGFNSGILAGLRLYRRLLDYEGDVFENEDFDDVKFPVEDKWARAREDATNLELNYQNTT